MVEARVKAYELPPDTPLPKRGDKHHRAAKLAKTKVDVAVLMARGLLSMDSNGFSDP